MSNPQMEKARNALRKLSMSELRKLRDEINERLSDVPLGQDSPNMIEMFAEIQRLHNLVEYYKAQFEHFAPRIQSFPLEGTHEEIEVYFGAYGLVPIPGIDPEQICPVEVKLYIRDGHNLMAADQKDQFEMRTLRGVFFGSLEEALEELVPGISALIWRAPLPSDLRSIDIPGVSEQALWLAVHNLAGYWHWKNLGAPGRTEAEVTNEYFEKSKQMFEKFVEPEINFDEIDPIEAYDRFAKTVVRTFENMQRYRGRMERLRRRSKK